MQLKWQLRIREVAFEAGLKRVKVFVKGPGAGRESAYQNYS